MVIAWNTGAAATEWRYNHKLKTKYLKVVRHNLKLKKKKKTGPRKKHTSKQQASIDKQASIGY